MKTACLCVVACFVFAASLPSYGTEAKKAGDRSPSVTSAAPPVYKFVELELYSRRIDAGDDAVKLNLPLPAGGNVLQYEMSPDSERVVYRVAGPDEPGDIYGDIYVASLDGRGRPVKINGRDSAKSWTISPDSRRVIWLDYEAHCTAGTLLEMRSLSSWIFRATSARGSGSVPTAREYSSTGRETSFICTARCDALSISTVR